MMKVTTILLPDEHIRWVKDNCISLSPLMRKLLQEHINKQVKLYETRSEI